MPLLVPVAALGLALMLAGGWLLQRSHAAAACELRALERLKQERDWLAHQVPAPTADNEVALVAEVAAAGRARDEFKRVLDDHDPGEAAVPAGPTEAFFELADFVGRMRARAGRAEVKLKADEYFGFAAYAHTGPAAGQVAAVHRQRLATEYLVERLLEARPHALLAVRREQPAGEACELAFTGDTAVLRHFLNELATGPQPAVVRGVQVEPVLAAATGAALASAARSKFSVTVEIVRAATHPELSTR